MKEQNIPEETLKNIPDFNRKSNIMFSGLKNANLFHLIFAKEKTDAGNYYNESSVAWLKSLITRYADKRFDIIKDFKDYIAGNLLKYFKIKDENKQIVFPEFKYIKNENGVKFYQSNFEEKLTSISVIENFLGDVESSQCFKPELTFKSDPIIENKPIHGIIKISLPHSKSFVITKSFVYTNEEDDDEIYVHFEGFKNSFKYEQSKEIEDDHLKDLKPIPSGDHTTFGPFLIKITLSQLASKKYQLKDPRNYMRSLMKKNNNKENIDLKPIGNCYEINFDYKIINKTR